MESVVAAWKAEGLRLLELSQVPRRGRAAALSAIEAAAEALAGAAAGRRETRSQRRRRRESSLDRVVASGVARRAFTFLEAHDLVALGAASKALKDVAMSDSLWRDVTRDVYPEIELLRASAFLADDVSPVDAHRRILKLWRGHYQGWQEESLPSFPGADAYHALVVLQVYDCPSSPGDDPRDSFQWRPGRICTFLCDVAEHASGNRLALDVGGALEAGSLPIDIRILGNDDEPHTLLISIALVRESDGKLLHVCTDLAPDDIDDQGVYFGLTRPSRLSCVLPLYVGDRATVYANGDSPDQQVEWDYSHMVSFEHATYTDRGDRRFRLTDVGDVPLAIWDPRAEGRRLPCWHILEGWAASKDWF